MFQGVVWNGVFQGVVWIGVFQSVVLNGVFQGTGTSGFFQMRGVGLHMYRNMLGDSLRAGRSGDRIPVGARFSAPVQTDPEAHPASYTMGTGSFPAVKRPGRGVDHPPRSCAEVKERVELYLCYLTRHSWPVLG